MGSVFFGCGFFDREENRLLFNVWFILFLSSRKCGVWFRLGTDQIRSMSSHCLRCSVFFSTPKISSPVGLILGIWSGWWFQISFFVHPYFWEDEPILTNNIFCKWVESNRQLLVVRCMNIICSCIDSHEAKLSKEWFKKPPSTEWRLGCRWLFVRFSLVGKPPPKV